MRYKVQILKFFGSCSLQTHMVKCRLLPLIITQSTSQSALSWYLNHWLGQHSTNISVSQECTDFCRHIHQGSTFRENTWGKLATKFSDLVASECISVKSTKRQLPVKKFVHIDDPRGCNALCPIECQLIHKSVNTHLKNITLTENQFLSLKFQEFWLWSFSAALKAVAS